MAKLDWCKWIRSWLDANDGFATDAEVEQIWRESKHVLPPKPLPNYAAHDYHTEFENNLWDGGYTKSTMEPLDAEENAECLKRSTMRGYTHSKYR